MKELYIVTHTESTHHLENLVGGWYDSELTDVGISEARNLGETLATMGLKGTRIISSDLKRAAGTAEQIARVTHSTIESSPGLREMSFGSAEGKPQSWLDQMIVPVDDDNRLDHRIVEGAETKRELTQRIYDTLTSFELNERTIICTHAYSATFIIAWWIGMTIESLGYVNFGIKSGRIAKLVEDDFFRNRIILYLNEKDPV
jgi:probable phosphoglycerate mutase